MLGITDYFWRLFPGNPILRRVVETGGKRRWHLIIRWLYLGLLVAIGIVRLLTSSTTTGNVSLATLAQDSASLFALMSYVQLGLVALLAPIFTAGAITQERDSQTYDILLSTPLTNGQIVLGSLMSRLFFVFALLLSGIPIYSATQIFGGVAVNSIVYSFLIAAVTALATGSIAMAIATLKVGTRRTIFSFYLFIVVYLGGLFFLDNISYFQIPGGYPGAHISWFTGLQPFLALRVVLNDRSYAPPDIGNLPASMRYWPVNWYVTSPQTFYIAFMTVLSLVMVLPSIVLLRRLAQSTISIKTLILSRLKLATEDRRRKPRGVWNNPIAWREARTKASAARAIFLRYGFIILGTLGAATLVYLHSKDAIPHQYVSIGSLDRTDLTHQTLYIQSPDPDQALTSRISPDVVAKVNDVELHGDDAFAALKQKLEVKAFNTAPIPGEASDVRGIVPQWITTIDLADYPRILNAKDARQWLLAAIVVEFAVVLLIVTNAAASAVTREKEDGTLDLLLSTPITSTYYIWGKLRGLVSFVLPLIAVPVLSVLFFVIHDICRMAFEGDRGFDWVVMPETLFIMPGMLIIVAAFAAILGMQMSLRFRTTVWAVMSSTAIIAGVCGTLGWCGRQMLISNVSTRTSSSTVLFMSVFSPFTALSVMLDPFTYAAAAFSPSVSPDADPVFARILIFIAATIAIAGYSLGVWRLYKAMVKNFDMVIRKQSR